MNRSDADSRGPSLERGLGVWQATALNVSNMVGSGGSYHFLREIYGRYRWGRLIPFLFIWQFLVSGALEMASGYIGALGYLEYALPGLASNLAGLPGGT